MSEAVDWDTVGWVTASQYRTDVLAALETPKLPSAIADQTDVSSPHVSRSLNELRERDLVELLVDEDRRKGRVYGRTERGDAMMNAIEGVRGDE